MTYDSIFNLQVVIFGVTNAADSADADKESNKSPNCQPKQMLVEEEEQIVNHSGNPVALCQDVQPIVLPNKAVLDFFGHVTKNNESGQDLIWTCHRHDPSCWNLH